MPNLAAAIDRLEATVRDKAKEAAALRFERQKAAYLTRRDVELLSLIGADGYRSGMSHEEAVDLLSDRRRELRAKGSNVSDFTRTQRQRVEIAYLAEVEAWKAEREAA